MMLRSLRRRAALCGAHHGRAGRPHHGRRHRRPPPRRPTRSGRNWSPSTRPTRADKALLQTLGLDLTEHAGQDYVEVVLHTAEDVAALASAGLGYDVRIPDLVAREAENNQVNAAYAAATVSSPLPVGPRHLPHAGRLQRRHGGARRATTPTWSKRVRAAAPVAGRPADLRRRDRPGRAPGPDRGLPVFLMLGVHHAREWPSGEHAMEFAVDLVKNYGTDRPDHRPGEPVAGGRRAGA